MDERKAIFIRTLVKGAKVSVVETGRVEAAILDWEIGGAEYQQQGKGECRDQWVGAKS